VCRLSRDAATSAFPAACAPLRIYDGDVEQREGIPAAVVTLKAQIVASAGVLLATPENNNGIPGVFKNAFDW
jgi:NAD(P)H-dependent FMN reductase